MCCEICLSTFLGSQFIINVDWEVLLIPIDLLRPNSNIIQWTLIVHGGSWGRWGGGGAFSVKIFYAMLGYLITTSRRERELSSSPEL